MVTRAIQFAAIALAIAGCKKAESESGGAKGGEPRGTPPPAKASAACKAEETTGALKWIADDFEAAVTCATAKQVPIVLDMWAPWCHTCLSMQTQVFTDPAFAPFADRFVFASLDTDREANALPVAAYPPSAWPTFWVISPHGEIQGRFVGAASVDQFRDFLTAGEQAFVDGEKLPADAPLALVRAGDRAAAAAKQLPADSADRATKLAEAQAAYEQALAKAPADWSRRPDVLVSAMSAIRSRGPVDACIAYALAHLNETGRAASAADFLVTALPCAEEAPPDQAKALWTAAATRLEQVVADEAAPLSADDRSDAMANLREVYDQLGRPADAVAMAERQKQLLDDAAAAADGPLAASTYNWPRAEVYTYLHKGAELVPILEKSAADLPTDYDPPYRLSYVYMQMKDYDHAQQWIEKAIPLVYGPRKARAQQNLVDILAARGDKVAERAAREALVKIYEALPPELARPADLDQARKDLAAMDAPPPATP